MHRAAGKIIRPVLIVTAGVCFWFAIGLAITVLVSWSLAAFLPQSRWKVVEFDDDRVFNRNQLYIVALREYTTIGATRREWQAIWSFGWSSLTEFHNAIDRPLDNGRHVPRSEGFAFPCWGNAQSAYTDPRNWEVGCEQATGWPLPALWYGINPSRIRSGNPGVHGGIQIAGPVVAAGWPNGNAYRIRALPLQPIWAGLAINSLIYAPIAWACWRWSLAARRNIRRRRGLCPFCGYDLCHDLSAGCSECGWNREAIK